MAFLRETRSLASAERYIFHRQPIFSRPICKASVRGARRNTTRIEIEAREAMPGVHAWLRSRSRQPARLRPIFWFQHTVLIIGVLTNRSQSVHTCSSSSHPQHVASIVEEPKEASETRELNICRTKFEPHSRFSLFIARHFLCDCFCCSVTLSRQDPISTYKLRPLQPYN